LEETASAVDVDGKIISIRTLHYDWKYKPEVFKPWKIKTHRETFEPNMKTLIPALRLAYKT